MITNGKGTVDKVDNWGVRKLAYRVSKYNEGHYVLVQFSSSPELVKEVERRMRVADMVIKFITVRIDEKQKKIEKRKKARDKRAARRPAPQVAAPAAPCRQCRRLRRSRCCPAHRRCRTGCIRRQRLPRRLHRNSGTAEPVARKRRRR